MVVRAAVFDLDDTLFLEREYVKSGFRCIAMNVADDCGVPSSVIFDFLWKCFCSGIRANNFDRLAARHPSMLKRWKIADLIDLYRSHYPNICLLPGIANLFAEARNAGMQLALLSDGPVQSQSAKLAALDLCRHLDSCILNDISGIEFRKPDVRGYEALRSELGLKSSEMVYVADNPEKDFLGARRAGWRSIRLRLPEQLRYCLEPSTSEYAPDYEVNSVAQLRLELNQLCPALSSTQLEKS